MRHSKRRSVFSTILLQDYLFQRRSAAFFFAQGGPVKRSGIRILLCWLALCAAAAFNAWCQQAPSAPITLKGPAMPAVTFSHAAHTRVAGKCEVCHHGAKPQKPFKSPTEACTDCHTKPPTPPVRVGLPAAFHNPGATAGLCITGHKTQNAEGKAAPVKCADCHKKDAA